MPDDLDVCDLKLTTYAMKLMSIAKDNSSIDHATAVSVNAVRKSPRKGACPEKERASVQETRSQVESGYHVTGSNAHAVQDRSSTVVKHQASNKETVNLCQQSLCKFKKTTQTATNGNNLVCMYGHANIFNPKI